MKIIGISTTTNEDKSSSKYLLKHVLSRIEQEGHDVDFIDANKLHIVKNLSCYTSGKESCAHPDSGKYRCWAHKNSHDDPEKFGGKDEMGEIYDAIESADVILFATSTRWMSHSALLQTIIERMNTLENRHSSYGEKNPLKDKICGVIVTGLHYQVQRVGSHVQEVMRTLGMQSPINGILAWQRTMDMSFEHPDNDLKYARDHFLLDDDGARQVKSFVKEILGEKND